MCKSLVLAVFLLLAPSLEAQNGQQLLPIEDLKSSWLTINGEGNGYVPFINGSTLNFPVIGIMLNTGDGAGLILRVCLPAGASIFIDNKIVDRIQHDGCRMYDLDSLMSSYNQESLFVNIFKKNLDPDLVTTTLMAAQPIRNVQAQSKPLQQITKRYSDQFPDFYIIAILMVAAYCAFLLNRYPKGYKDFFNFSKAFSLSFKEEKVLTQRNMNTVNALFLWLYSMIITLVIILFWKIFDGIPELFEFVAFESFSSCFISWFAMSLLAYAVVWMKYALIKTLCSMLNVDKIAQIHFFDFMRISFIFVTAIFIALSVVYLTFVDQTVPFTIGLYLFVSLLAIRIIILLFKLIGDSSFRKIHLISYLCTTEILPLLIGIRIFF